MPTVSKTHSSVPSAAMQVAAPLQKCCSLEQESGHTLYDDTLATHVDWRLFLAHAEQLWRCAPLPTPFKQQWPLHTPQTPPQQQQQLIAAGHHQLLGTCPTSPQAMPHGQGRHHHQRGSGHLPPLMRATAAALCRAGRGAGGRRARNTSHKAHRDCMRLWLRTLRGQRVLTAVTRRPPWTTHLA